ncbi:PaaI family thioesterase [Galactobacter sp.]|uniref:PaaI family thioesterase n=1 Tax=Galactobacter sp. TaxID=2676125 RepID=UPI0025BE3A74|nr:hotdog fold thioesterase [Galactobacter sp.]
MDHQTNPQPSQRHTTAALAATDVEGLRASGIPEEAWPLLPHGNVGSLVPKLGIHFDEFTVDRVSATMPVQGNTQVVGLLHGGATAALAETLGSFAAAIHAGGRALPVGVDLNITHHRGARDGLVTGVATPLHLGRTTATHAIEVTDETGRRIATARITNQLLPVQAS